MSWYKSLWLRLHGYRTDCLVNNIPISGSQSLGRAYSTCSGWTSPQWPPWDRRKWPLWRDGRYGRGVGVYDTCFFRGEGGGTTCLECQAHDYHTHKNWILYVAQYPAGTSMRPLKTKTQFLRRPFQFSVNEVFWMKPEHFTFKMKVLASLQLAKQLQKAPFCSGE